MQGHETEYSTHIEHRGWVSEIGREMLEENTFNTGAPGVDTLPMIEEVDIDMGISLFISMTAIE